MMESLFRNLKYKYGPKKIAKIMCLTIVGAMVGLTSGVFMIPDEPMTEEEIDYDIELEKLRGRKR